MEGERFGYSIDIGKELEKDETQQPKPEEQKPEEPKAEELQKQEEPKAEAQPKQDDAAKQESTAQEQPQQSVPEQPSVPVQPQEPQQPSVEESPAGEEFPDEEPVEQEPPRPPDPVEEDINAIITRDFPELNARPGIWERIVAYRALLIFLLFVFIAGWFAFILFGPEEPTRMTFQPEVFPAQPVALAALPIPVNYTPVLPAEPVKSASPEERFEDIPLMLAERLRD